MRYIQVCLITACMMLTGLAGVATLNAQSTLDLRINELLVHNDSNYVDDYGRHGSWIEIFNSAYNTVDMGGMYLTNDLQQPTKYRIPKGQMITQIPSRSFLVFWADNRPTNGILHLNFELKDGGVLALYDASGKTLVDSVKIPDQSQHDVTWGRIEDGGTQWTYLKQTTPGSSNLTASPITGGERFAKVDPKGFGMTMIAMGVVFLALIVLFLFFKFMGWSLNRQGAGAKHAVPQSDMPEKATTSGEINAAIAMALYMHKNQLHDHENTVLTINQVSRTYSPWSSKIYGLRRNPR
ncbi:MAG: OadG family protein [Marinilabiliaceae bacterium]|nr:OadG family protein [Marinilabiliaceae bacterium]